MNNNIKKALSYAQEANYSAYFDQMDKVVPASLQTLYEEHKGKFIAGQYPWNFYQQLETFAKKVDMELQSNNVQIPTQSKPVISQPNNSKDFKSYYIQSIEDLKSLPIFVEKTALMSNEDWYNKTLSLYYTYEKILNEYNRHTTINFDFQLENNFYKQFSQIQFVCRNCFLIENSQ